MYSSTFTRPRIASKPDSSTIPLPRTPAAQTTVSDLINSVSSPFATIMPSSVASLIAVPMRNSTPFSQVVLQHILLTLDRNRKCCWSSFYTDDTCFFTWYIVLFAKFRNTVCKLTYVLDTSKSSTTNNDCY